MFTSHNERPANKIETSDFGIVPPPSESLLSPNQESLWPEEIRNNKELIKESADRKELIKDLTTIFSKLPQATTEIQTALGKHQISTEEGLNLYKKLTDFLLSDSANNRMILYMPFEFIPNNNWKSDNSHLNQVTEEFKNTYINKWKELLTMHDWRANFVDGDIPEPGVERELPPEVCKAAHLLPILVKKGLVSVNEAINIVEKSSDSILRNSFADGFSVLADQELITKEDITRMLQSEDDLIYNCAIIVSSYKQQNSGSVETKLAKDSMWLKQVFSKIKNEVDQTSINNTAISKMSVERVAWLKQNTQKKIIETHAQEIANALISQTITFTDIQNSLLTKGNEPASLLIIHTLRNAVEKTQTLNPEYKSALESIWKSGTENEKESIKSTWSRWISIGVLDDAYLNTFGIKKSALESTFSEKTDIIKNETEKLSDITNKIASHPELLKYVYPVSILYGSIIKGYNTGTSDADCAIFVKPDTPIEQNAHIQKMIFEQFGISNDKNSPVFFWLNKNQDGMEIQNFKNPEKYQGDSTHANILFEGAWCGDKKAIESLYKELLPGYLYSKDKKILGHDARTIWLESLERATLQYRLMHSGYARSYPEQGGIETKHSNMIDSQSMFWDSGYRRLATKLFLSKVFLPQLEK